MRNKYMEFDIWLEDQMEKSDRPDRIFLIEGDYNLDWDKNLTKLVKKFKEIYPNDYNYYYATFFLPISEDLNIEIDIKEEDLLDFSALADLPELPDLDEEEDVPELKDDFFI